MPFPVTMIDSPLLCNFSFDIAIFFTSFESHSLMVSSDPLGLKKHNEDQFMCLVKMKINFTKIT